MSALKPPSGRASRSEVRTLSSASESNAVGTSQPKRRNSFSGRSRRLSNSGRETPVTGERNVNRIMGNLNLSIKTTSAGRMGLLIGNAQSELEALQNKAKGEVNKETKKLKNMESHGKTSLVSINKQKSRVKKAEKKLTGVESAIEKVMESKTPKRSRNNNTTVKPIKRTKSTEGPPTITTKPPSAARKPTPTKPRSSRSSVVPKFTSQQIQPNAERRLVASQQARNMLTFLRNMASRKPRIDPVNNNNGRSNQSKKPTPKTKSVNFLTQLKNATGKVNRSKEIVVESQAPTRTNSQSKQKTPKPPPVVPPTPSKKNNTSRNSMNDSTAVRRSLASKFEEAAKQNSSKTNSNQVRANPQTEKVKTPTTNSKEVQTNFQTPPTKSPPTTAPSIKNKHREAKNQGSKNLAEERKKLWEQEGPPAIQKALEPLFNKMTKQKNTPPGITKTNIERLLQPFKQPVTVTVAPTISVKGGSAKATGGSSEQRQVQYKTPANKKKKPLKLIRSPETMRKEKSAAFRKEIISKLRSPMETKRREALYSLRTPTVGQRKKHVIQLIDRVLRRMKAPKDAEKKLIKFYEGLSEKQIKSLFGGRSPEFVKNTLKKQIDYLKKKR